MVLVQTKHIYKEVTKIVNVQVQPCVQSVEWEFGSEKHRRCLDVSNNILYLSLQGSQTSPEDEQSMLFQTVRPHRLKVYYVVTSSFPRHTKLQTAFMALGPWLEITVALGLGVLFLMSYKTFLVTHNNINIILL